MILAWVGAAALATLGYNTVKLIFGKTNETKS